MGKTNYLENEVLKLSLGKALALTLPITPYLALFTTLPGEDGTGGVEVSGGGYARVNVSSAFPTPSGTGSVTNSTDINFGTASGNWGNVKGVGILTAASGGQLLRTAPLTPAVDVNTGSPVVIPAGSAVFAEE